MMIAILDPIRISGERVAAASSEGTSLPGGWRAIQRLGLHSLRHMQS